MQCPIDGTQLVMTDRSGVEIDYCPNCRGVWLDRGELDKIIERSGASTPPPPPQTRPVREHEYERGYSGDHRGKPYRKKNKAADFLGDLFDF